MNEITESLISRYKVQHSFFPCLHTNKRYRLQIGDVFANKPWIVFNGTIFAYASESLGYARFFSHFYLVFFCFDGRRFALLCLRGRDTLG